MLTKTAKREYHPSPNAQETLGELGNANHSNKLNVNCGYWQIKLHREVQSLFSFTTPFGRYVRKRLPFAISSAPKCFQRDAKDFELSWWHSVSDGSDQNQHDDSFGEVLSRRKQAGAALNQSKCEFGRKKVKFLGHIIDETDPDKTNANINFSTPTNKVELRRFTGIINCLGNFPPLLNSMINHLR